MRFLILCCWMLIAACAAEKKEQTLKPNTIHTMFTGPVPYYPRQEINRRIRSGEGLGDTCNPPPTHGDVHVLVLPVLTQDVSTPPQDKDTPEKIESFLFGNFENTVSLSSYFEDVSGGTLHVTGHVANWTNIEHSNAISNATNGSEYTPSQDPIVERALQAFDEGIDYAEYDSDQDGCIDFLMIIHAGEDQAITRNPSDIWSHFEWYGLDGRYAFDQTTVYGASILSVRSPIGVYAHEFAHNLGLPDLYSYGPPNKSQVGYWSLMDLGTWSGPSESVGSFPTGLDAYSLTLLDWSEVTDFNQEENNYSVSTVAGEKPTLLKINLPSLLHDGDHYLLIQARINASDRGVMSLEQAGNDAFLSTSGVLVWEIDEYGSNYDGSPKPLVTVADAYPNEMVRGISKEALLQDAPFVPKQNNTDGVSSRYDAHGVRIDVQSKTEFDAYELEVNQDTTEKAELKGQLVRVTHDPHALGDDFRVDVQVTNVGAIAVENLNVHVFDFPGNYFNEGNDQFPQSGTLEPGEIATFTYTTTLRAGGHFDLYARVSGDNVADLILRDKAYVDTHMSEFSVGASTHMSERVMAQLEESFAWEYSACVRSQMINDEPFQYARVSDCKPSEGHEVCDNVGGGMVYNECLNACDVCSQFDYAQWMTQLHDTEDGWIDFPDNNDTEENESHTRGCYRGGGFNACRGEVTKIWVDDFNNDGNKEILVAYRDLIQSSWCADHELTNQPCSDAVNPLDLSYLSMYRYSDETGLGEPIWEFSSSESLSLYPSYTSELLEHQVYSCLGTGMNASVIDVPHWGKSILISGLCGHGSVLFYGNNGNMNYVNYPIDRPYGGDEIGFDANLVLTDGELWGESLSNDANHIVAMSNSGLYTEQPRMYEINFTSEDEHPTFASGSLLSSVFSAQLTSANLNLLRNQSGPLVEWYQTSPSDENSRAYLAPRAFMLNTSGDDAPEMIFADGNGINTGRVLVFEYDTQGNKRVRKLKERWGNLKSALLPFDFDGDGQQEIVLGDNGENAISVFKYISATDSYEEIFRDSFGGYTGSGYNPGITVGDVDGDGTPNLILGMGGHCSRPTVGDGVYVYGHGMVFHVPDMNNNDTIDPNEDDQSLGVFAIASGDLNNDGKDEIVVGTQNGELIVLKHDTVVSQEPSFETLDVMGD